LLEILVDEWGKRGKFFHKTPFSPSLMNNALIRDEIKKGWFDSYVAFL